VSVNTEPQDLLVGMAEIGILQHRGVLRALLGSCVGVVLYERSKKLLGLAHVVMPDSLGKSHPPGKYADTAVPEMIRRLHREGNSQRLALSAKLFGGANMFANVTLGNRQTIGDQNLVAVEQALAGNNIPVLARHLGGTCGRRIIANAETGIVEIHCVGQPPIRI
jgi:chemotaxis protein CheD